jgi:hypothetical protein
MSGLRRKLPYRRSQHFGFWLVFLLASAGLVEGWIFFTILDKTIGPVQNLWRPAAAPIKVALLRSVTSSLLSEPNPEDYFDTERQWEIVLNEAGIGFRVIGDEDLTPALSSTANVLVLPSAVCVSDAQRAAIKALAQQGMGMVASGALGARNANCSWKGWDTLTAVTGIKDPDTVSMQQDTYAGLRGGQFYSEMIPAGYRLSVPPQELILGTIKAPDLFWSDGRLRPARGDSADSVALGTHAIYGKSRVVWFGFKETLPDSSGKDQRIALNRYLTAAVRWVGRQPLAAFGNWPGHRRGAVMIAESVQDAEEARPAAEMFRQEKIPATFFIASAQAQAAPGAMNRLRETGEIASAGDTELAFAEQDLDRQTARLRTARKSLERLGSPRVVGFDPPQQVWDSSTVTALEQSGYSYYFDHSAFERAVPELMVMPQAKTFPPVDPVELARISAMAASDIEVISHYRGPKPYRDDLVEGFLQDFRMSEYLGGLYTLSFRSDLLGTADNLHIVQAAIKQFKDDRAWIASGEGLTTWWSQRDKVRVESRAISATRIRLSVSNRSSAPMLDASVYVYLPHRPKAVRIQPSLLNRVVPRTEIMNGIDDVLRLDFSKLNAESGYVCVIVLDEN